MPPLSEGEIWGHLGDSMRKLAEEFPPDAHLFCPKVSDEDDTTYEPPDFPDDHVTVEEKKQRVANARDRQITAYYLSILLSVENATASEWRRAWEARVEKCLTACDACVKMWHKSRGQFLEALVEQFPEHMIPMIEQRLREFDKSRIDRGLARARSIIESHDPQNGPMTAAKLTHKDITAVIALFEALYCPEYFSGAPESTENFDFVFRWTQQKKPLKINGGIIPIMTRFLFDEDPYRSRFSQTAWRGIAPGALDKETWNWAVMDNLGKAIVTASMDPSESNIKCFWQGFMIILRALSEELVIDCLRGMEVSPDVYMLALDHLATPSVDALETVLEGLRALMSSSHKAFWAAYNQVTPSQLGEELFKSPAFAPFIDQSFQAKRMVQLPDREHPEPALAVWVRALIASLTLDQRSDVCESLLRHLFDVFRRDERRSPEARATCTLAGMVALGESLSGFLQPSTQLDTNTLLIMVNNLLNCVVQYRDVIMRAAELKTTDVFNVGLSDAAIHVVQAALSLDAKATWTEWHALVQELPVQDTVNRASGTLWESFLEMLWSSRADLGKAMLLATMPLRRLEKFLPMRKGTLTKGQDRFNQRWQQQSSAVGKMLLRLSDFNPADLDMLCSGTGAGRASQTILAIVASLIHGEEAIREAGFELIKAITGEISPSEAVNEMLRRYLVPFLDAFAEAVDYVAVHDKNSPWSHMIPLLKCSEFVLNGLSDPSVGLLRSKTLTTHEQGIVKHWWQSEWRAIDHGFLTLRSWHARVGKEDMENFCRDVMELAEKFFTQDGLMISALAVQDPSGAAGGGSVDGDAASQAMAVVLDPPRKHSAGLVDMLSLKDRYLVQGVIGVLKKLLGRLKDNKMVLPNRTLAALHNIVKKRKQPDGRFEYVTRTNLTDAQRIELLKGLGEDAEIEALFYSGIKAERGLKAVKKQGRLDFSKAAGTSSVSSGLSLIAELTSHVGKAKTISDSIKPRPPAVKPQVDPKAILATQASLREKRAQEKAERAKRDAEAIARAKALRNPVRVPGEGSGLQGIAGVKGKDFAPAQKNEIMVGSSDEEEDDNDSGEDEALLAKARAGKQSLTEAEQRQLRILANKQAGPVKKEKMVRSAKDMRARIIPNMDPLHQVILEWDIFHEGNDPPNGYQCLKVSETYTTHVDYRGTFFPLLINEAWRSFVTAKDEATSKPFGVKALTRVSVDRFWELTASVPVVVSRDRQLGEGDIVILSKGEDPLNDTFSPHCLARIRKTTYKKDIVEVLYRVSSKNPTTGQFLVPGQDLNVAKITNMTTIEREYAALGGLEFFDLREEILNAQPSPMLKFGDDLVREVMTNYQLNPGQARAILNAKENDGFTLIQGPPGTGKTKTIVAMVGCLLTGVLKANSAAQAAKGRNVPGVTYSPANGLTMSKKLLVCAPSNAAVDEIVLRLKQGVKTMNGSTHKIEVIRLGRSDAINADVRDVTLDELVKARMGAETNKTTVSDREKWHQEAGEIKAKIALLRPQLDAAFAGEDRTTAMRLQRELDEFKRQQAHLGAKIDTDKQSGNTYARELEIKRRQVQQEILDKAQVLCATLSGSGHEMFRNLQNVEFETVIIDEAAQCVELSALIPLKYGATKCVLVGDPKQLPPTVLSQSAARYGYDQSLFVRMQKRAAEHVHLLDEQYRMHPEISRFPSTEFYEGLLRDGADMAAQRHQPWHRSTLLGPYRFFDVRGSQERGPRNQSLVNEAELRVAMRLYQRFMTDYGDGGETAFKGKIGIITPYKAQLFRLRQRFQSQFGEGITDQVEFNTTDAFQGRECEIVIFSCVRASPTGGIGFMTDIRRMNVGLTRARSSLWILGDSRALVQGEFWGKLIEDARRRDRYTVGDVAGMLERPGERLSDAQWAALGGDARAGGSGRRVDQQPQREVIELPDGDGDVAMSGNDSKPPTVVKPVLQAPATAAGRLPKISPGMPNNRNLSVSRAATTAMPASLQPPGGGLPIIQTGPPKPPNKRPLDGGAQGPDAKKKPIPYAPRPKKPDTDPSAMETLGLAPPTRPPRRLVVLVPLPEAAVHCCKARDVPPRGEAQEVLRRVVNLPQEDEDRRRRRRSLPAALSSSRSGPRDRPRLDRRLRGLGSKASQRSLLKGSTFGVPVRASIPTYLPIPCRSTSSSGLALDAQPPFLSHNPLRCAPPASPHAVRSAQCPWPQRGTYRL